MNFCSNCGNKLDPNAKFCSACGASILQNNVQHNNEPLNQEEKLSENNTKPNKSPNLFDSLTSWINSLAGGSGAVRPPLKTIFSEVFAKHTKEQTDELFIVGTSTTTPELTDNGKAWPRPWLWARILLVFLAAFFSLHICCNTFVNLNTYPGLMVVGAFAMPVATLMFFFELNTPRNISFYSVLKYFLVGGCASLVSTLFLFEFITNISNEWLGAVIVGIIEEVGKLVIVAFIILRNKKKSYLLNGLLIGAAVGAGFAAFESAGYAFRAFIGGLIIKENALIIGNAYDDMMDNILLRGFLAPGGHVIWAAMSGYAIMLIREKEKNVELNFLTKTAFWKIFIIPIVLHSLWDMPISFGQTSVGRWSFLAILIVLGWIVIFVLIANALSQIGKILNEKETEQKSFENQSVADVENSSTSDNRITSDISE